jgi:prepilin-type N-terminal cleavage/methylation domain-containing protein/prepilin-type processing-associated H-X9-DG protein
MANRKNGFTLVELLVVIAIIALLLSILMPSLKKVRDQAKTVICSTRMTQWGQGLVLYTMDNRDIIPYVSNVNTSSVDTTVEPYYWFDKMGRYISNKENDRTGGGGGNTYSLGSNFYLKVRECAASTIANPVYIGVYATPIRTNPTPAPYYYERLGDGSVQRPIKLSSIANPSSSFAFLDVRLYWVVSPMTVSTGYKFNYDVDMDGVYDSAWEVGEGGYFNGARPKTHSNGTNLLMFDGHREYVKFKDFWKSDSTRTPTHQFWKFKLRSQFQYRMVA